MNRLKPALTAGMLTLFAWAAAPAFAQIGATYTLTNNTGSAGGSFPITTLETFQSLTLTETFADNSTLVVPLYRAGVQVGSLSAFQVRAATRAVDLTGVVQATISGTFSNTSIQVATTSGGPKTPATILSTFSTSFLPPTQNSFTFVLATDATSGQTYHAGQFNTAPATLPATTPEPGALALLLSAGLVGAWWRRRIRTSQLPR